MDHSVTTSTNIKQQKSTGQDPRHCSVKPGLRKDTDTDKQIFALGDAASQFNDLNLDDFFANISKFNFSKFGGDNGNQRQQPPDGALVHKEINETGSDGTRVKTTLIEGPQYQAKRVHITKTVSQPDGSTLPQQSTNGPIATIVTKPAIQQGGDIQNDASLNGPITTVVTTPSQPIAVSVDPARKQSDLDYHGDVAKKHHLTPHVDTSLTTHLKRISGSYDNFHGGTPRVSRYYMPPGVQETSLSEPTEEDKLIDPANDRQFPWSGDFQDDDVPPFPATLSEQVSLSDDVGGIQRAAPMDGAVQQQYRPWEHRNNTAAEPREHEMEPPGTPPPHPKGIDGIKRKLSQHLKFPIKLTGKSRESPTDSVPSSPKIVQESEGMIITEPQSRKESFAMDDIQWYDPNDQNQLEGGTTPDEETVSVNMGDCMTCHCTSFTLSQPKQRKKRKTHSPKGASKTGIMMAAMKPGSDLPGLHALVANYAKMLYQERSEFVDTLFRAVKLNKVDVVKILCKIVSKSDFALSSYDLREPESSATILHVALLYNHADMIDYLLSLQDPHLILAKYETDEYRNQTGLHVAVANGDVKVIENLLLALQVQERQVLINTIADGHYFKTRHPHGQLCLTAAAWAGHYDVVKLLVKYGGNMRLKNSMGNTLLHSIIIQSATYPDRNDYEELFNNIWEAAYVKAETLNYDSRGTEHRRFQQRQMQVNIFKQLLSIRNQDGYTPLALATRLLSPLLEPMLNLEKIYKIPQNKLGSIAWVTYDVTEITSFAEQRYNKFSILHILAHNGELLSRGADPKHSNKTDVFSLEPVRTLLENKWSAYRWVYNTWCMLHIVYMVLFTGFTIEANSSPYASIRAVGGTANRTFEVRWWLIIFCFLPAIYIILEILDLFGNRPFRIQYMSNQNIAMRLVKCVQSEWTIIGNGPYRMVNVGFACFNLQWFLLYASEDPSQDVALAMSLLLGWIFVLFFTRGCRVTCRFSIMIQNLFLNDLVYFLTVYSIVLIGFSFAMNAMFTFMGDSDMAITKVFYDMMNVVTDLDQKVSTEESRFSLFTKLLLIVYAIVAVILLLNMLIAMMNTSYEIVTATSCNLWKQQQVSIMLMLERRFFWLKWLPLKSEQDLWCDGDVDDDTVRYFLDITMLHSYKKKS